MFGLMVFVRGRRSTGGTTAIFRFRMMTVTRAVRMGTRMMFVSVVRRRLNRGTLRSLGVTGCVRMMPAATEGGMQ